MLKSTSALLFGAMLGIPAIAAAPPPTYEAAREFTDAMHWFVAETGVWDKKPLPERIGELRRADHLVEDARRLFGENVFGPFGRCWAAANFMKSYVLNMNDLALILEGRTRLSSSADVYAPMRLAFQFGDEYRSCRNQIETLYVETAKAKR